MTAFPILIVALLVTLTIASAILRVRMILRYGEAKRLAKKGKV